jgi:hypothetical protein
MSAYQHSKRLFLASEIGSVLPKLATLADLEPAQNKVAFVQNAAIPYGNPEELF